MSDLPDDPRLRVLRATQLLDSPQEAAFDRLTRLAAGCRRHRAPGGDEFVVLAIDAVATSADTLTARLGEATHAYNDSASPFRLSLSVGISVFDPASPSTIAKLLSDADARMYEEKQAQRRRPVAVDPIKLS